jgi:hypothetical protein
MTNARGQTGMIMIVLLVMIVAAVVVLLLSMVQNASQSQEEYMNVYVTNLMLAVMKTDTGFSDSNCKLVSDALACAFVIPNWPCGQGITCSELADDSLNTYMNAFDLISQNYRYLFEVETTDFLASQGGQPMSLLIGDESLLDAPNRRTSVFAVQKSLAGSSYNLRITLYFARKLSE